MIVSWIELAFRPLPWETNSFKVAYVASTSEPGNYRVERLSMESNSAQSSINAFLDDLERTATDLASENGGVLDLNHLLMTFPDRGTAIWASAPYSCRVASIDDATRSIEANLETRPG